MQISMLTENERRSYVPSRAFTIIELLVVLGVMGVLAAMTVFAFGPLTDRSAVSGGGALLQTWMNTARQRAIRDKTPAGIRFLPGNTLPAQAVSVDPTKANANYVTRMVYLEGGTELAGTLYGSQTTFTATPQLPNFNPSLSSSDTLIINSGLPHPAGTAVNGVDTTVTPNVPITTLTTTSSWPYAISKSAPLPFRIIRAPNAVTASADSENILQMPRGSCVNFAPVTTMMISSGPNNTGNPPIYPGGIDLGNYGTSGSPTANYVPNPSFSASITYFDIMFAPDGTVLSVGGQAPPNNPLVFWVCSTAAVSPLNSSATNSGASGNQTIVGPTPGPAVVVIDAMRGNPGLVVVYPKTGQIVSYNVEFDPISVSGNVRANALKDLQ